MDTTKVSLAIALGFALLVEGPTLLAQSATEKKPTVRRRRVPVEQPAPDPLYSPALAEAETALEKKDYASAEKLLKQVLASNEKNYRAWFDLGSLYAATDRKAEAISALQKSVAAKPDIFESNLNLGLLLASSGQMPQAAEQLRKATLLKPSSKKTADQQVAEAWMALGRVLESSKPSEALAAFQSASRLVPKQVEPHLEAARVLENQKQAAEAEREYQQALTLKPNDSEAQAGLARVYIAQKRFAEAESLLRKRAGAGPPSRELRLQLARLHMVNQKYDDAIAELNQILATTPDDREAKRELAGAAASAKKYDIAEKAYRELAEADPEQADLRLALGTVLMKQRKFPQAEAEFVHAVKLDPKLAEGYGNIAIVAAENQHYELALKALDARAQYVPDNAGTYFLRATCFDHLKAFKQASENYRKFLEVAEGKFPTQEWQARHRLIAIEPKK
ncbi:MAG: tetratricopeptide repeat protein [Acidobacteriales bacterium]|nr:tetratricopeptide repeat protein [Terriglobales bacterium]